jgi:hypothetical protein
VPKNAAEEEKRRSASSRRQNNGARYAAEDILQTSADFDDSAMAQYYAQQD